VKQEPELIDIFALFAMQAFLQTAPKNARSEEIAYESYAQAKAMMNERTKLEGNGNE
jgi:hypothetical protein